MLQSEDANRQARRELERRGWSMIRTDWWGRLGQRLQLDHWSIGDLRKSWDVLQTAEFIEQRLGRDQPIVDFGAFHSEITGVLCRMGYTSLHGVDLNPRLARGPYRDRITYTVADFLETKFADGTFAAVTAISAIEHGHAIDRLLSEVGRLLKPGGYFIGSTDYWPDKVDTGGIQIFNMPWTVFSEKELAGLFEAARKHDLVPAGPLDYRAGAPVIDFAGKRYTFAWFAMRKELRAA